MNRLLGGLLSPLGWNIGFLEALGIMVDDPRAFGESALIAQRVRWKRTTETLEEARARWKLASSGRVEG